MRVIKSISMDVETALLADKIDNFSEFVSIQVNRYFGADEVIAKTSDNPEVEALKIRLSVVQAELDKYKKEAEEHEQARILKRYEF